MTAKRVAKKPPPRRRPSPKEDGAKRVKVAAAKGRPMLTWVGKRPLSHVTAFPAQHVETFDPTGELDKPRTDDVWADWPEKYPKGGLLFHGDNKDVLAHLLANGFRGKIDLIYIDPPFDSGADYVRRVSLRGPRGTVKIEGEGYTLGEQIQYTDIWANDEYLQFIYERLLMLRELLSERGLIFMHTDWHKTHLLRCLLDEVFGGDNFRNEITVKRGRKKNLQKQFSGGIDALGVETDTILLYSKSPETKLPLITVPERGAEEQWQSFWRGNVDRPSMRYEILGFNPTHGQLLWNRERGLAAAKNYEGFQRWQDRNPDGTILQYWQETGETLEFVRYEPGTRSPEYWLPPKGEGILGNEWLDIQAYSYGFDYKTEKAEGLLERVVNFGSSPGDLVLDCFVGSGTTVVVAQKFGRRWIACDINAGSIQTTAKRLLDALTDQTNTGVQTTLANDELRPQQLAFTTWRVNDYDLVIAHEEAAALASEHLGVQRTRTDPYFDGTLGRALVKIVSFTHPLSPLDLERLRQELDARPNEDRAVTVVCLGIELAAQKWIEAWNKRPGRKSVNKIDVIELRSDPRYGGLIRHEPAKARVNIARSKDKIVVVIEDFISPTIIERLAQQTGIVKPKIDDWRQMVDCVMVDPTYDGSVFDIAVSDVPAKKNDFVDGRYELPAPKGKTTVAVKIIDMLGEEVLTTADV